MSKPLSFYSWYCKEYGRVPRPEYGHESTLALKAWRAGAASIDPLADVAIGQVIKDAQCTGVGYFRVTADGQIQHIDSRLVSVLPDKEPE